MECAPARRPRFGSRASGQPTHAGFTLVELLVVVAIISILATITVMLYNSSQGRARTAKAQADARAIASALTQYAAHCGALPGAGGDGCQPGGSGLPALTATQTNTAGSAQQALLAPPGPLPPAGWGGSYAIAVSADGTFSVTATPLNGDNGGAPVRMP